MKTKIERVCDTLAESWAWGREKNLPVTFTAQGDTLVDDTTGEIWEGLTESDLRQAEIVGGHFGVEVVRV